MPTTRGTVRATTANLYRLLDVPPIWTIRRGHAVKVLDSTRPDVILVQECTEIQERYLLAKMDGPWGSASDHVNVGVMYRADRYKRVDHRPFTMSNIGRKNRKRYASGAILENLTDGLKVCFVSPHLASSGDGLAEQSRPYQTEQLLHALNDWGALNLPCVIGGDWNDSGSRGVEPYLEAAGFKDVREKLGLPGKSIDRFFTNAQVTPTALANVPSGIASDHDFKRTVISVAAPLPPPEPVTEPPVEVLT
jgi:endonuclease/exonuclease/phosphatase family metal-dependent hydrolase